MVRHPPDDHVEERADYAAEHEREYGGHHRGHGITVGERIRLSALHRYRERTE